MPQKLTKYSYIVNQLLAYLADSEYTGTGNVFDTACSSVILLLVKNWHVVSMKKNSNVHGAQSQLRQCHMAMPAHMLMPSLHQGTETRRNQ
jgi:hypothetical protein